MRLIIRRILVGAINPAAPVEHADLSDEELVNAAGGTERIQGRHDILMGGAGDDFIWP